MKLLTEVSDLSELNRLRLLFESSGVLVHIGNEDSARNFGFLHPVGKYAIHVVYEEQFDDAVMLLEDENHIVEHPIDVEAYQEHIKENKSATVNQMMNITILTGIILFLVVFGMIWFITSR